MKKSNRKMISAIIWLMLIMCLLPSCNDMETGTEQDFITQEELANCELYLRDITSPEGEIKVVTNKEFKQQIIEICMSAEQFRPFGMGDMSLGISENVDSYGFNISFKNSDFEYNISSYAEFMSLMSFDEELRDEPLITVAKIPLEESESAFEAYEKGGWGWYCTLTAEQFSRLYEAVRTFSAENDQNGRLTMPADFAVLEKQELMECELFIHNASTASTDKRTVTDEALKEELVSLCLRAEMFRPMMNEDSTFARWPSEHWPQDISQNMTFRDGESMYVVSFFDAEGQLAIDAVHRDEPVILVSRWTPDETGAYPDWLGLWYCTMPAADYAQLYEMVYTYDGGQIVRY